MFPTVPQDSSGVAHILEHVVLAGSERFPVRDPFFSMIPRSLKTFMNAMTSSDWTMYPFSSRNEKDFFNLLSVYLDAAFFPLISLEAFKQEGHRLEFEDPEDPSSGLRYKGVVFNEMKGTMATPASVMHQGIGSALFPGLTYANNSGGDPEHIPDLTWEQLKAFHAGHYHPSNSYFFSYGSLPMERILFEIEDRALSRFKRKDIDVSIPDVERYRDPKTVELAYPLSPAEDPSRKHQALLAWVTNHVFDSFETLTLRVIQEVLLGNPAAPLYRALIGSGLGDALADGTGYHADFRQTVFGAGLQGIAAGDGPQVEQIVLETLSGQAEKGLDPEQVEAAIHQLEFETREVSNRGYPFSLKLFFELSGAFIYGGDPYRSLQFEQDLAQLREAMSQGRFLEEAIERWFLKNRHRALLLLAPDPELETKKTEAELRKLAQIESGLSEQDRRQIVEDARRLRQLQENKEDLSVLPTLELSDVPMNFERIPASQKEVAGAHVGFFPQPTNGITYLDTRADFSGLPDALIDRLALFAYAVPKMGAAGLDYLTMAQRITSYTGGISSSAGIRPIAGSDTLSHNWTISGKALARNHDEFFAILHDLLTAIEFDEERLHELIAELRAHKEAAVVGAGTAYAQYLASSKLSPAGALEERLNGISQLALLKTLGKLEPSGLSELIGDLGEIAKHLFRNEGLRICVTAEEKSLAEIQMLLEKTMADLSRNGEKRNPEQVEVNPGPRHEARTTSVPIAFNVRMHKAVGFTHPDAPALLALGYFMRATYLHREIREKGGAYGSGASFDAEKGQFTFSSYRDPNIARTYRAFQQAIEFVTGGNLDPEEVKEAILSASGAVDPLESPDTKGRRRFFDDLSGYSLERREQFKKGLLSLSEDDLVRVAGTYLANGDYYMSTISNEEMIADANSEMDGVFEVAPV